MRIEPRTYGWVPIGLLVAACGGSTEQGTPAGGGGAAGAGAADGGGGAAAAGGASGGAGTAGTAGGSGAGIQMDQVPAKIAEVFCATAEQCMGPLWGTYLRGGDCKTLVQRQLEDREIASWKKAEAGGTLAYHADKAQSCLDAYKAGGCAIFQNRSPDVCEQTVEGKVASGGACTVHAECAGPLFCQVDAACPGKCAARVGEGAACKEDEACQDGLVCWMDGNPPKCAKPAQEGQSCGAGVAPDCAAGMLCLGSDDAKSTPGTCTKTENLLTAAQGASCDIQKGPWCVKGSFCTAESLSAGFVGKCAGAASSGAACKFAVPDPCPAGEYCNADVQKGKIDGTCTKLPAAGSPCSGSMLRLDCAAYTECDKTSNTCKAVERIGGACSGNQFCYSDKCSAGACASGDACPP